MHNLILVLTSPFRVLIWLSSKSLGTMLTAHSAAFVFSQEQSASQIESGLLDQIRVVWPKLVIPVWVEKSICIFITVGMYAGMADTELLSNRRRRN